jgi:hypothetical protein
VEYGNEKKRPGGKISDSKFEAEYMLLICQGGKPCGQLKGPRHGEANHELHRCIYYTPTGVYSRLPLIVTSK